MRSLSRIALALATVGVLVAIVRACLRPAAHPDVQAQQPVCGPALTPRVALVVIDALRADTFFGDAFADFRRAHPAAASGVVRSSPVSMSTAGIRSMATGTFPDLFDVLHNWDNVASDLKGVPGLARDAGLQTMIFGDSIWRELFPRDFVVAETEVNVPRIIYYLRAETLVDEKLVERLTDRLRSHAPPDFLVLHLVGLDHAGHRRGVKAAGYADVARRIVAHVENTLRLLPADTTVVVTSDHGATESGGHGGGSEVETTVPLFAFGAGIAPGARANIHQVDLAPTLSCLLGLPFPATSLGRPAAELFEEPGPARVKRLRAGLSQVEQAWARPTGAALAEDIAASSDDTEKRALDARFARIFEAFARNVARTRVPVGLWGLLLLVFLVAHIGELRISRSGSAAVVALLGAGIVVTAVSGPWSLAGLSMCVAVTLLLCARSEWGRTRFASRTHALWLVCAGVAVALALARDTQGRSTTLLFGSPSDPALVGGGAALCLALRALERRLRTAVGEGLPYLMLPILFVVVIEGGEPAIAVGTGFFAAWLVWDAALGRRTRHEGQSTRVLGALAQGAVVALYLAPHRRIAWIRGDAVATAIGAVTALSALWLMRPRSTSRGRSLAVLAFPAFVAGVALLRKTSLGETAVQIALALTLVSLVVFVVVARWREDAAAARWGMACVLVTLWWLLCTPPQRLVLGLAVVGLIAFARAVTRPVGPAASVALVGLALAFWRWGLVGHFEGEFGFGSLEVSLAYVGNPGRHVPQGAFTLLLKAWLPLAVAAAVFVNEEDGGRARDVLRAAAFVLGARVVHLAVATAVNPDSFYTMHRILGELTHEIVFLIGIGLFSFVTRPRVSLDGAYGA